MLHFFSVLIIAISLSMDTFSLSMAYGMMDLENSVIKKLSIIVGIFHFFMPLIGNSLGEFILSKLPFNSSLIIGVVFLCLSVQIMCSLFKKEEISPINGLLSMLIFALTVSLDSFSVGLGLTAVSDHHTLASTVFMFVSFAFTYVGLKMGKKLNDLIGRKAQVLGMILLLILSVNYIIKGC